MFEVLLIIAAVGYVLVRRMMGEPAVAKRMLVLPAVLTVIGLSNSGDVLHSPMALVFLLVTGGIGLLLGALRGASVRITGRDGVAFVQYRAVTVALWVASLAVKFVAGLVLDAVDKAASAPFSGTLLLTLGAGMLVEGLVILMRALKTDTRIIWAKGKDGAPHTMSPFLDNLQNRTNGTTPTDVPAPFRYDEHNGSTESYPTTPYADGRQSRYDERRSGGLLHSLVQELRNPNPRR